MRDVATLRPEFAASSTNFAFDMLAAVSAQDAGQNVFLSPANASIALAMAANGAQGETLQAFLAALNGDGATLNRLNIDYAALQALLKRSDPKVELSIANSLWAQAGVPFNDDYLRRVQQFYDAEVAELDFSQPEANDTVNAWVAQNTNGKIDQIVGELSPETILLIVSAIYFLGSWERQFDKTLTQDAPFTLLDGSEKTVPMMYQSGSFSYLKGDGFQAVHLPYVGGALRMAVVLPDEGKGLADLTPSLTGPNWQAWSTQFEPKWGNLALPRFRVEYEVSLNDALARMGMDIAFDADRADFSAMRPVPPNVFISNVQHKTYIDVNEEGTEAAAVTSVEMGVTSAGPNGDIFTMLVNRPFFVAIEDVQTGIPIFLGTVFNPE
jgi:serpin B